MCILMLPIPVCSTHIKNAASANLLNHVRSLVDINGSPTPIMVYAWDVRIIQKIAADVFET